MRFANSEEIKRDHCLFDERRYEKEYEWLYYNFSKNEYLFNDESDSHGFALKSLTNLKIKETLEKPDESNKEKSKANELYIEKLIKIVHSLARNNLPVKELYPKMIKFLSDEINEPIVKQYLEETHPKNASYDSSDSCDSTLVALNSHLKEKSINTLINAVDLAIFADEATSAATNEMSAYDEEKKDVVIEFVSIASVSSTKSEVLMDKVQEILLNNNIDISNTRFSCLDGTNAMSGENNGLRRRIHNLAPFSIYVNCRSRRLALHFKHLFDQFPWLESIDSLLLGLWKAFYYSGKNRYILRPLQEAHGIKALNLVKAVVTKWLSHGAASKRCRERYHIIIEAFDDIISTTNNPELVTYRNTLLDTESCLSNNVLRGCP